MKGKTFCKVRNSDKHIANFEKEKKKKQISLANLPCANNSSWCPLKFYKRNEYVDFPHKNVF